MCNQQPGEPCKQPTAEQWNAALKLMGLNGDWTTVVESAFGSVYSLSDCVGQYNNFDDIKKWLYFIALSIFGTKNGYLQHSVYHSANYKELCKSLFRSILVVEHTSDEFAQMYAERKEILKNFVDLLDEAVDYCKVLSVKEDKAIYYLTDLTQPEKERVFEWLNVHGHGYTPAKQIWLLSSVISTRIFRIIFLLSASRTACWIAILKATNTKRLSIAYAEALLS